LRDGRDDELRYFATELSVLNEWAQWTDSDDSTEILATSRCPPFAVGGQGPKASGQSDAIGTNRDWQQ
jgi:hypothetical protein